MTRLPWQVSRASGPTRGSMLRPPTLRRMLAASFAVLALTLVRLPAFAASQLLGAHIDTQPGGSEIVVVQFGGTAPKYSVVGSGTAEVSLIFNDTSLGANVAPTIAGSGGVSSISLAQTGAASSISLHLASAVSVQARATGNAIAINIPTTVQAAAGPQGVLAAPVPGTGLGALTEIVYLKYADVSEIAGVLVPGSNVVSNDNFQPISTNIGTGSIGGSLGGFGGLGNAGGGVSTGGQNFGQQFGAQGGLAQRVNDTLAIDRRLNAIVLTGPPDVVQQLKNVIERLDVPVKSVILECEIVELSDTASKDIGVDFNTSGALGQGSYTIKNLQPGGGTLNLSGNIYGQVVKGQGKILAKPRILAQSGTSASILTGDAIPILTAVVVAGAGSVTSNQVNYINVGVSLQIQPRVSDDGFVTSHIYSEVSSVTGLSQNYPTISQRQATTSATVKDGESFVIGGLLQDNEIRSFTKLPFVGDIPIIGALFGHTTTSRTQSNLYIVVTPHIVGNYASPPAQTILAPVNAQPPAAPASPEPAPATALPIVPSPTRR